MLNQAYAFQSGKRQGKAMELMMFDDYGFLLWYIHKLNSETRTWKNAAHLHLEELLQKGENRQPKMFCPQCHKKPVEFFSLLSKYEGFSIGSYYTCCGDKACKQMLCEMAAGNDIEFLHFKFSVLRIFYSKSDKRRVANLFKKVFELPGPLTRQFALDFFNE
ncbi:hypothetical protein KKF60_01940 [Patescibacteria group bacterium]|nr:hypothetical protein [Patescibacteria group bacterium]MBU4458640.1 hypothetical protein [Patescibacteria group bacterium]MCG2695999.1 hypothetical protein [Candidatus Portnoybacteria bacterium]